MTVAASFDMAVMFGNTSFSDPGTEGTLAPRVTADPGNRTRSECVGPGGFHFDRRVLEQKYDQEKCSVTVPGHVRSCSSFGEHIAMLEIDLHRPRPILCESVDSHPTDYQDMISVPFNLRAKSASVGMGSTVTHGTSAAHKKCAMRIRGPLS